MEELTNVVINPSRVKSILHLFKHVIPKGALYGFALKLFYMAIKDRIECA